LKRSLLIIGSVLLLDQVLKIWIKTHMYLGQEFRITDWFIIHFTENNGMAFGMELGGDYGKLFLSLFRIVFVSGMAWFLYNLIRSKASGIYISVVSLVFAGAIGNIIDSVFYGVIFSASDYEVARLFPPEGGYAGWLHGRVVDMFYFPLISGTFPQWFPVWGGESFLFFRPVFNLADAAISVGVFMWIIFQKKIYPDESNETVNPAVENSRKESDAL
jgi:signal peptidase II